MSTLTGAYAVVTGAASAIGVAICHELAARGAWVRGIDRTAAPETNGPAPTGVEHELVDLASPEALAELAERIEQEPPQVLVCGAAAYPSGGLVDADPAEWELVWRVNVHSAAVLMRGAARGLARTGTGGSFIALTSIQELLPVAGEAAYVSSKGALTSLVRAAAVELGSRRIRVNAVAPGVVESTAMLTLLGPDRWGDDGPPTLLGRAGEPRHVADAVAFLAGPNAEFITGATLPVDGGRHLSRRPDPFAAAPAAATSNRRDKGER